MDFILLLKEKVLTMNLLVVSCFVIGIIFFIISSFNKNSSKNYLKIGGVTFVTFLALLADTSGVYALTIFIIATFITKLDFLENIAAIFWGRKEYWEYKIALVEANSKEKNDKVESEIKELYGEEKNKNAKPYNEIKNKYLEFENACINQLKIEKVFLTIKQDLKIMQGNMSLFADAVASTLYTDFVIEVKMSSDRRILKNALVQVKNVMAALRQFNSNAFSHNRTVKGIVIVPETLEIDQDFIDDIAILKFDHDKKEFTNLAIISPWILKG